MIQVQRFNKALKSAVIIGDLVILDVLFVLQYILWTTCLEQKVSDGTLYELRINITDNGTLDLSSVDKEIKCSVILAK